MYFGRKYVETGISCSHALAIFLKYTQLEISVLNFHYMRKFFSVIYIKFKIL